MGDRAVDIWHAAVDWLSDIVGGSPRPLLPQPECVCERESTEVSKTISLLTAHKAFPFANRPSSFFLFPLYKLSKVKWHYH